MDYRIDNLQYVYDYIFPSCLLYRCFFEFQITRPKLFVLCCWTWCLPEPRHTLLSRGNVSGVSTLPSQNRLAANPSCSSVSSGFSYFLLLIALYVGKMFSSDNFLMKARKAGFSIERLKTWKLGSAQWIFNFHDCTCKYFAAFLAE